MVEGITQSNDDLNKALVNSIQTITSLKMIYEKANLEGKQKIIGSIFPRKFVFDNNRVRTNEINEVVGWFINGSKALQEMKTGQPSDKTRLSRVVIPPGFEP